MIYSDGKIIKTMQEPLYDRINRTGVQGREGKQHHNSTQQQHG